MDANTELDFDDSDPYAANQLCLLVLGLFLKSL